MKKVLFGLLIFGLAIPTNSQTIELPNTVISVNYEYLEAKNSYESALRVKKLEKELLNYDHTELSQLYDDQYDLYEVTFSSSDGKIIAAYNKDGKIISTVERYYNVKLPYAVMQAIAKQYPNWGIIEDKYLVKYHVKKDSLKQEYKIKIQNDDEIKTLKTDEKGLFL